MADRPAKFYSWVALKKQKQKAEQRGAELNRIRNDYIRGTYHISGMICDRRMAAQMKGKFYKTVVRPVMMYGLETGTQTKRPEWTRLAISEGQFRLRV